MVCKRLTPGWDMVCKRLPAGWDMVCKRLTPGWDMVCNRLTAGISHRRVTICTPAGGALLFCEEK